MKTLPTLALSACCLLAACGKDAAPRDLAAINEQAGARSAEAAAVVPAAKTTVNPTKPGASLGLAHFPPVDEAGRNPDFLAFRTRLLEIVKKKDVAGLKTIVDPGIKASFGGHGGWAGFAEVWQLERKPGASAVWQELGGALRLGGAFNSSGDFSAPYVYAKFPDKYDAFTHGAIVGSDVNVREAPKTTAPVIVKLSHTIVPFAQIETELPRETIGGETHPWRAVTLGDGRIGYVYGKFVRSPLDYRAGFHKTAAGWKLVFFVAGD